MWPLRHKKTNPNTRLSGYQCPHCKSTHIGVVTRKDSNQTDYIKVWRGHRSVTCKCLDCGSDFYSKEPSEGITEDTIFTDDIVNEEELQAAEDEVKRQTEEDDDRTCR